MTPASHITTESGKCQRAYRTEVDPTDVQRTALLRHAGVARWAWNWGLAERKRQYAETGKSENAMGLHKRLTSIKASTYPWLYDCSKCAPQAALRDLDRAYEAFFRGVVGKGPRRGFPRFKRRKDGQGSFRLAGAIRIEASRMKLPMIGWVRLKEHGYLPANAKINSATLSQRAGRWFVSLQVEESHSPVDSNGGSIVGIDLGLTHFATLSDGTVIDAPKPLARQLKHLKRLARHASSKVKGSQNRRKANHRLATLHYKIHCQRQNFLHQTTSRLAKTKGVVVIEDLAVANMVRNRSLARAISDVGWGQFRTLLAYKAAWYGCELIVADRFYPSTKRCSECGALKALPLSERIYVCDGCGSVLDRDLNAAKNLASLALDARAVRPQRACGAGVRRTHKSPQSATKQEPDAASLASVS